MRVTPAAIVASARKETIVQLGSGLNNLSVLQLNAKLQEIHASRLPKVHPILGHKIEGQDPAMAELAAKQKFAKGLKAIITNTVNINHIVSNPFESSDFTLGNLKKQRH